MSNRQFTPYELNQLQKYGLSNLDPVAIGEKPVEYLAGHAEFFGQSFLVNESTLIPRLESEQIVSVSTTFLQNLSPHHLNIADIGTGSGCLGISIASSLISKSITNFDIYLSDVSNLALKTAADNAKRLIPNHNHQFHFLNSDLLSDFPNHKFDLIVANLPYIPSSRIPLLDPSVKDYEPILALDGGPTGAEIVNRLLSSIEKHLKPNFLIILEIDSKQPLDLFTIPAPFQAKIKKDIFDRPRFLTVSPK